ncbi:MAG: hypothetical protein ABH840_04085 [Nanoarchaeota archaeon]
MAKLTAWLVTVIGVLLVLAELDIISALTTYNGWIIALAVLVIGVGKLMRNYKKTGK